LWWDLAKSINLIKFWFLKTEFPGSHDSKEILFYSKIKAMA
jgi:hypothetical protein